MGRTCDKVNGSYDRYGVYRGAWPRIDATLCIRGSNWDANSASVATALVPTRVIKEGDPRRTGRGHHDVSEWRLGVSEVADSWDTVLSKLVDVIWPARERLRRFVDDHNLECEIAVSVTITEEKAEPPVNPETMTRLATLGIPVTVAVDDYSSRRVIEHDDEWRIERMIRNLDNVPAVRVFDTVEESGAANITQGLCHIDESREALIKHIREMIERPRNAERELLALKAELRRLLERADAIRFYRYRSR